MRWLLALIVVAGCDDVFGLTFVPDARPVDALQPIDAPIPICYGRYGAGQTGLFQFCTAMLGTYPQAASLTIDTDTDTICAPNAAAACVVTAPSIEIANLRAIGSRPLVLVSASTLIVTGAIDLSSHSSAGVDPTMIGAGADPADCVLTTPAATSAGGAGGSFQTMGGAGGKGAGTMTTPAAAAIAATMLRGGCPGNSGTRSGGTTTVAEGSGGAGGGVVYLIAATLISIHGTIDASGSPGTGASAQSVMAAGGGGGGGGAGGLIGLDSPMIAIAGVVIANGAGGGGGGGGMDNGGTTGRSASTSMPTTPALGGAGGSDPAACNGGSGFAGSVGAGDSQSGCDAGGGGGGGAGYVKVFGPAPQITGMVSPAPD